MWMEFWYALTMLGSPYLWSAIGGILFVAFLFLRKARPRSGRTRSLREFLFILVPALAITFILIASMKAVFNVERICLPCPGEGCNPYCPLDASFPSGHSATIFAGFTSAYIMLGKRKLLFVYIVPVLVGLSRIALDVHMYPDVIAGALIGAVVAVLVYNADRKLFGEFS